MVYERSPPDNGAEDKRPASVSGTSGRNGVEGRETVAAMAGAGSCLLKGDRPCPSSLRTPRCNPTHVTCS